MRILVINGPNINMLGIREPDIYGKESFSSLLDLLEQTAKEEMIEIEESYLWRNSHALHSTKGECSVIGYAIAKGKTSGINIYDTYLMMKSLVPNHLVIYEGAKGEWATDK